MFCVAHISNAGQSQGSIAAPTISSVTIDNNAPTVGDTLTATVDATGADSISYQWKADGSDISGETSQTYVTTRTDAMGKAIAVTAIAHNVTGDSAPTTSSATSLVTGAPVNTVAPAATPPSINRADGGFFSTTDGTWTGYPTPTFTYLWALVTGTNGLSSYEVLTNDPAVNTRCSVTASNSAGSASANSNDVNITT